MDNVFSEDRLMNSAYLAEDSSTGQSLRPHTLKQYVGQKPVKGSLNSYIQAALSRRDALDHILLYHPGLHRCLRDGAKHPGDQRPRD